MAIVDLHGLTKVFGHNTRAVDELELHIKDGELVSLLGPSGCGKTTTLRLVAGFLQPDEGEVRVDGKVIASPAVMVPPERRNMSMIFQSYAIWPHMTVFQNVAYGLKFRRITGGEADKKVREMLRVVKLESLADRYPAELSGGQQQRVALARALVVEPQILLLDEPLSNLDANLREEMRFEIRRLHDEFKITSIYVTHDQSEAMVIADRICVMNQGRMDQVGRPEEVYERPKTRFVSEFIGKTNLLSGTLEEGKRISLGNGLMLRVGSGENFRNGEKVWVSVRPHDLQLDKEESKAEGYVQMGLNLFYGTVSRRFYFGESVDYLVQLAGADLVLRVITPPAESYDVGQGVYVVVHPDRCVIVGER
ncbi:MAG: ABC transporter ATP-binding protein [Deltaproteobacteria bacterium]|nr:ABC transporter ATP-binding protein [Deltaproteobacteria bacterium]